MARQTEQIRIGMVGLGWMGQEISRAALEDLRVRLVGVADVDPSKAGRDLGELIGEGRLGITVDADAEEMLSRTRPEVAVLATGSSIAELMPTIRASIRQGAHVVTTCEALAGPGSDEGELAEQVDRLARERRVVVLGTGVNPGFAMDRLPTLLSQATRNIRKIRVRRVVDAASRRAQLQAKVGIGMTPRAFAEALAEGKVGHVGLLASLRLVAKGLGVALDRATESLLPVVAEYPSNSSVLGEVEAGSVRGIYQVARGYRAGRELITLELHIALDEPAPKDTIDIIGEPPLHFEGELPGDQCTVATVLSAIPVVVTMPAGLRTVLEVPLERPEEALERRRLVGLEQSTMLPALARDETASSEGLEAELGSAAAVTTRIETDEVTEVRQLGAMRGPHRKVRRAGRRDPSGAGPAKKRKRGGARRAKKKPTNREPSP